MKSRKKSGTKAEYVIVSMNIAENRDAYHGV
jgi:hypothetical protein